MDKKWKVQRKFESPSQGTVVGKDRKELRGVFYTIERKMTKEEKKYPDKLYVYREDYGDGDCLLCYESMQECADLTEERTVAVYVLDGTGTISVEVVLDV